VEVVVVVKELVCFLVAEKSLEHRLLEQKQTEEVAET
jgi:hypothetical protein